MLPFLTVSAGEVLGWIALSVVLLVIIIIFIRCIVIVPQAHVVMIQRLGKFHKMLTAGFHIIAPFIDARVARISLKEKVADFPPQPVITKDNVTMQIDTVLYFAITDPKLYLYGAESPMNAIENLTATTLRNLIGDLELDQTLTSRDTINQQMRMILDDATDSWGIKVNRVELKNILPPREIQEAMEKQMRAERQKREAILTADGQKQAAILAAEGEKEAAVLRSEARKIAIIAEAEGHSEAVLRAAEAQAKGIEMINKAHPDSAYLTLKGFEALEKVADGKATKIIIPSEIQNISGLLTSLKETLVDIKPEEEKKK